MSHLVKIVTALDFSMGWVSSTLINQVLINKKFNYFIIKLRYNDCSNSLTKVT